MKNVINLALFFIAISLGLSNCSKKEVAYNSVNGDPMNTRIYTLDNGLKVYMSVYKDAPRIQTLIGVRAGSKNDPATSTGLAHYFEHLMFKGTSKIGTKDFQKEEPILNEIESLFELYRQTSDSIQRSVIYHQIDSLSYEASKYAVSNEYDRLMSYIGSTESNAWTSTDQTVYTENIPSNELENWAIIQGERFRDPVIRIFHTELETVYEEKNRSLNSDESRVIDSLMLALYPHHTYGTQSTLGTDKDLKSPSITNIKKFFKTYYVPNNMAISLAGDFNPDSAIAIIQRNFGQLIPDSVPQYIPGAEPKIDHPILKNVEGVEPNMVYIGYRLPGEKVNDNRINDVIKFMLSNGSAGLFDLNINQKQKLLSSGVFNWGMTDYTTLFLIGYPKEGQNLQDAKNILLAQIDSLKTGNFGNWLLKAAINNLQLAQMRGLTNNNYRAMLMMDAFTNHVALQSEVESFNKMKSLTKEDIVNYANEWFKDDYAIVYKHQNPKFRIASFPKPKITPVDLDRNSKSDFFKMVEQNKVTPIEPQFVNFQTDLVKSSAKNGVPVLYKQNEENGLFDLTYILEIGTANQPMLSYALNYLSYLGTSQLTSESIKEKLLTLACQYDIDPEYNKTLLHISGLSENMDQAIEIVFNLLQDAQGNDLILKQMIEDEQMIRVDNKTDYGLINRKLQAYGKWGALSPESYVLSNKALQNLKSVDLLNLIHQLTAYKQQMMYYGPYLIDEFLQTANKHLPQADSLLTAPPMPNFIQQPVKESTVYLVNYPSKQTSISMISRGSQFDTLMTPEVTFYNQYFQTVAFQELREARGLAYSVRSGYYQPEKKGFYFTNLSSIGTQTDKLETAISHFEQILKTMPLSPDAFQETKLYLENSIRTQRYTKDRVLKYYYRCSQLGYERDPNQIIFEKIPTFNLFDLQGFQETYIAPARYNYCVLGDIKELDLNYLKKIGALKTISNEVLFGY